MGQLTSTNYQRLQADFEQILGPDAFIRYECRINSHLLNAAMCANRQTQGYFNDEVKKYCLCPSLPESVNVNMPELLKAIQKERDRFYIMGKLNLKKRMKDKKAKTTTTKKTDKKTTKKDEAKTKLEMTNGDVIVLIDGFTAAIEAKLQPVIKALEKVQSTCSELGKHTERLAAGYSNLNSTVTKALGAAIEVHSAKKGTVRRQVTVAASKAKASKDGLFTNTKQAVFALFSGSDAEYTVEQARTWLGENMRKKPSFNTVNAYLRRPGFYLQDEFAIDITSREVDDELLFRRADVPLAKTPAKKKKDKAEDEETGITATEVLTELFSSEGMYSVDAINETLSDAGIELSEDELEDTLSEISEECSLDVVEEDDTQYFYNSKETDPKEYE